MNEYQVDIEFKDKKEPSFSMLVIEEDGNKAIDAAIKLARKSGWSLPKKATAWLKRENVSE
jgi:hypothetical protein